MVMEPRTAATASGKRYVNCPDWSLTVTSSMMGRPPAFSAMNDTVQAARFTGSPPSSSWNVRSRLRESPRLARRQTTGMNCVLVF